MRFFHSLLALLVLSFFAAGASAFSAGDIDTSFNSTDIGYGSGGGVSGFVENTAVQADGKILLSGNFSIVNGENKKGIVRLSSDGLLDHTFDSGTGANSILTTPIQPDGKIIIGGQFTSYNGISIKNIGRINPDGSLDETFVVGTGADNAVRVSEIQSNGKILIGGYFTSYNGISRNHIARLNTDGSIDDTFDPGDGANNHVEAINYLPDGKIIICGQFTSYNGSPINRIARLNDDGSLDTSFNPGSGPNSYILSALIQSDGKIVIVGDFISYNGVSRNKVARLNVDGSLDESFVIGSGTISLVKTVSISNVGKLLIGGDFTSYNGLNRRYIVRLNSDGSLDTTFTLPPALNNSVTTISLQGDGKVIVGGYFTQINGIVTNRIMRLNDDGSIDSTFNKSTGINYTTVVSATPYKNGNLLIGGSFVSYFGIPKNNMVSIENNGDIDTAFSGSGPNGIVYSSVKQPDGNVIICGGFTTYGIANRNRVARVKVDGSIDTTFLPGTAANGTVFSCALQSDGKIIIGGNFTSYAGTPKPYIARLTSTGSLDTTFNINTGPNGYVYSLLIQDDGKILIGGNFTSYDGVSTGYIARVNIDGSLDSAFDPLVGTNGLVKAIAIQPDGKIYIGGDFTFYDGVSKNYLVRLNSDGSLDSGFSSLAGANGIVNSILIQVDRKIIVGGEFTEYNGAPANRIIRLNSNGDQDIDFDSAIGADNNISIMTLQSDGSIIIGGSFTSYKNIGRNRIARIHSGETDADGIEDAIDNCTAVMNTDQINTDNDEVGDACDSDDDNDQMPDAWENLYLGLNALVNDANNDLDSDGFTNLQEYQNGTNPIISNVGAVKNDLDADADSDLVFQDGSGNVSAWLLENTAVASSVALGTINPHVVKAICDVDGDDDNDLLFQNAGTGGVILWVMEAGGKQSETWLGALGGYTLSACGDSNKDGNSDLVFADATGNFTVMTLNSNHTVLATNWLGQFSGWSFAALADADADSDKDIVMQTASGDIGVITLENGNTQSASWLGQWSGGWAVVGAGDADNDKDDDVFIATANGDIGIVKLQGGANAGSDWFGQWADTAVKAIGDIDNDGDSDVVFQSAAYDLDVIDIQAAQKSAARWLGQLPGYDIKGSEDSDGDGDADLVLQDASGNVAIVVMEAGDKASLPWLGINNGALIVFP